MGQSLVNTMPCPLRAMNVVICAHAARHIMDNPKLERSQPEPTTLEPVKNT